MQKKEKKEKAAGLQSSSLLLPPQHLPSITCCRISVFRWRDEAGEDRKGRAERYNNNRGVSENMKVGGFHPLSPHQASSERCFNGITFPGQETRRRQSQGRCEELYSLSIRLTEWERKTRSILQTV